MFPEPLFPEPLFPELLFPEPLFPELLFPEPLFPEPLFPELLFPELLFPELLFPELLFPELLFSDPLILSRVCETDLLSILTDLSSFDVISRSFESFESILFLHELQPHDITPFEQHPFAIPVGTTIIVGWPEAYEPIGIPIGVPIGIPIGPPICP